MLPLSAAAQSLTKNAALVLKALDEVFNKRDVSAIKRPDGHFKLPHLWPPQIPPGKDVRIMVAQAALAAL